MVNMEKRVGELPLLFSLKGSTADCPLTSILIYPTARRDISDHCSHVVTDK